MTDLHAQLKEIDALRERVLGQLATQTDDDKIRALEMAQPMVKLGSKEHEALLATGYRFDKAEAQKIIKERDADPRVWPFEMYQKAKAFLEALNIKKVLPSSTRKPWRTRAHSRVTRTV